MPGAGLLIVRGVLSVLLAIVALIWPQVTVSAIVILFGVYALVEGVTTLYQGFRGDEQGRSWGLLALGLLGITAGVVAFTRPGTTLLALIAVIGAWAILRGVFELVTAVRLRRMIENEWLLGLSGVMSLVFGVLVLLFPLAGALALAWLFAGYLLIWGAVLIALGLRLRRIPHLA